ncbi:MAG: ParB/RepB/Spo0J family partition protein [Dokdonella sp.]|nr:ParB/RepB/Spo0J family partition protein [Dokdonella sp.]
MNTKHKLQNAPAGDLLLIPLSQLRPSRRNVRRKARPAQRKESIAQLAESIARVGLLQNLVVTADPDGETYNIEAGERRYDAMKLLVKQKRLDQDAGVPCRPVVEAAARTASLTENVQREAMHPADEFEAFAALVGEGRAIEDIAADFGVTPIVVKRRLKLANVSRRLMDDYRGGVVTLEQLMALAITDDHAAQEAAFYDAPEWQRDPSSAARASDRAGNRRRARSAGALRRRGRLRAGRRGGAPRPVRRRPERRVPLRSHAAGNAGA